MLGDQIHKQLSSIASDARQDVPLSKWTTFKIGGPARYMVTVATVDELRRVLALANEHGLEIFIFGGGSNMLVADAGFEGIVIRIGFNKIEVQGTHVIAQAGAKTAEVAQKSVAGGLTGFEWGVGVPGTIGGAVRGNAGASGGEMKDAVECVQVLVDNEIVEYTNAACGFGYRHSAFKESGGIVLSVTLTLTPGDPAVGMKKIQEYLVYRMTTQPKGFASTGCIFKNAFAPDGSKISAGKLIDQAGLKGFAIGGAKVSDAHGNFVINIGTATADDVRKLVETIKEKVYTQHGIHLEEEIQYVGF